MQLIHYFHITTVTSVLKDSFTENLRQFTENNPWLNLFTLKFIKNRFESIGFYSIFSRTVTFHIIIWRLLLFSENFTWETLTEIELYKQILVHNWLFLSRSTILWSIWCFLQLKIFFAKEYVFKLKFLIMLDDFISGGTLDCLQKLQ